MSKPYTFFDSSIKLIKFSSDISFIFSKLKNSVSFVHKSLLKYPIPLLFKLLLELKSKREELIYKLKITSSEETEVIIKRIENLEKKLKKLEKDNKKLKIKKARK